ncbi:hypothetical protein ACFX13_031521 [Malus domestica]
MEERIAHPENGGEFGREERQGAMETCVPCRD